MPTYRFNCTACKHAYETYLSFAEYDVFDKQRNCPQCNCKKSIVNKIGTPIFFVKTVTTVGQQAELNARKMGSEQVAKAIEKNKTKVSKVMSEAVPGSKDVSRGTRPPWWRDGEHFGLPKSAKPVDDATAQRYKKELKDKGVNL